MGSISPGEVLELAKTVYRLYKKFHNAPEEMHQTGKKVVFVQTLMEDMEKPGNQLDYLKSPQGKRLKSLLDAELRILKQLLREVEDIGRAWKSDSQSIVKKPIFIFITMKHLPELRSNVDSQMDNIGKIRLQAHLNGAQYGVKISDAVIDQIAQESAKSVLMVQKLQADRQDRAEKARKALESPIIDDKDTPKAVGNQKVNMSEALQQAGFSAADATQVVTLWEKEQAKQQQKGQPGQKPNTGTQNAPQGKYTGMSDILVVDATNGARAIMAQTYLELIRAWSINNGSRWLFKRVDSAGWKVDSEFRRGSGKLKDDDQILLSSGRSCFVQAVDTFTADHAFFITDDWPNEKKAIVERVKEHKNRGIRDDDFTRYEYILCFDQISCDKICALAPLAQKLHPMEKIKSQITFLQGCSFKKGQPLGEIVGAVRNAIDGFLTSQNGLAWTKLPKSITGGPYRTCWVPLKDWSQRERVIVAFGNTGKRKSEMNGCKLRVSWQDKEHGWVAAITGPKDVLAKAESKVRLEAGAAN